MRPYRFFQFLFCFLSMIFSNYAEAQYITVDNSTYSEQQLVEKFIGVKNSSCVTISGVTVSGGKLGSGDSSYGYFSYGNLLGMNEGLVLSTGSVLLAPGPKKRNVQSVTASDWIGDSDLAVAIGKPMSELSNATILEFDFTSSLSNKVSFRYKFLSEEYHPGNYSYSDAFAFLIKKSGSTDSYSNIALVPGTSEPVSATTINDSINKKHFEGFIGFKSLSDSTIISPTNFNGQTKVLTAVADIEAGTQYHIKLVIADQGKNANSQYDSAVFLEAGSFTGNIDLLPNLETDDAAILCDKSVGITLKPKNPSDISDPFATYAWYEEGTPGVKLASTSFYQAHTEGDYRLEVELSSGCTLVGNIRVEESPIAQFNLTPIRLCDDDFDLDYTTTLSDYNNKIITNYDSSIYDVLFYNNPTGTGTPITKFNFTQNTTTLYVKANAYTCDSGLPKAIQFVHGPQLSMNYPQSQPIPRTFDICDDELAGSRKVNLEAIVDSEMTAEKNTVKTFYLTETQAKKGGPSTVADINPTLSSTNADKLYFVRIEDGQNNYCPNYSSFRLLFKQPKKSTILKDTLICKGAKVDLDAGPGFSSYRWYDKTDPLKVTIDSTRAVSNLPAGDYAVELGFNGCVYKQSVKISEPADLIINNTLIEGDRVTVFAANGIPPYRYKLDNGAYQSSNVFDNVKKGDHTIEVMDACGFLMRDFSIINIKNVITPNNDGINDTIDYSDLMTKLEPRLEIYDRNGILVFKGDKVNQFIWNGTSSGRILPTSSYWYILEWNESGNPKRVQQTGWILLKNRN